MISFVVLTWNRPPTLLRNSLYTLSHQSVEPREIVVVEASPGEGEHAATRALCDQYPLVKLIEAYWPAFNVSRGMNVGIKRTSPESQYVAATCMEIFFSEGLVEALSAKVDPDKMNFVTCGSLFPEVDTFQGPEYVRANWNTYCSRVKPNPPVISPGALLCAERDWWFEIRGYDEARRPYRYPDVDLTDRALKTGVTGPKPSPSAGWPPGIHVGWHEAQVLHPWHPLSPLFHSVGGHPVDSVVDANPVRNLESWGEIE